MIIITHYPLHAISTRYTENAGELVELLNAAADEGMTIVFLWGHNHGCNDNHYDRIFKPGDVIETDVGEKTIRFYYAAAGCMSDLEYGDENGTVKGKGLVIELSGNDGTIGFTYYDIDGKPF